MRTKLLPWCARAGRWFAAAGLLAAGMALAINPPSAVAQGNVPPKSAAGTGAARSPAVSSTKPTFDTVAQYAYLRSDEWHSLMSDLDDWFAVQNLYDAQQVKKFKSRLAAGIEKMSAEQLKKFAKDMRDKLEVLRGDKASAAAEYLRSVESSAKPTYTAKIREKLPDILSMSASEVNARLGVLTSKHQSTAQLQKAFDESRQQRLAYLQEQARLRKEEHQQAIDHAMSASAAAAAQSNNYILSRDFYPTVTLPFDSGYDGQAGVTWTP